MALDGSTLDMPNEKANADHFGYPGASRGNSPFPQLYFVALAECGTRTLCYANPGPCRSGERHRAGPIIDQTDASMLVTADRNFYSYAFWQCACATQAKLLFRVLRNLHLQREQELPDGSYLTTVYPSTKARRRKTDGIQVRVIEYTLEGIDDPEPVYRLITNRLDSAPAPAPELAALYHRRWTI